MTLRAAFDRFAEATTHFVSHGLFFTVSVVLVVIWFACILVMARRMMRVGREPHSVRPHQSVSERAG